MTYSLIPDYVRKESVRLWNEGYSWDEVCLATDAPTPAAAMMMARRWAAKNNIPMRNGNHPKSAWKVPPTPPNGPGKGS